MRKCLSKMNAGGAIVSIQLKLEKLINVSIILLIVFFIETLYTRNGKFIIIMRNNLILYNLPKAP